MKVVFISNYINHHQIPFSNAMNELLSGDYAFIQTEKMEEERIRMGWQQENDFSYLYKYYEEPEKCARMILDADVAIFGGTDEEAYIVERLKLGKVVIRYSERLYKSGQWKAISPRGLKKKYNDHTKYRNKEVYLLCSGAYVSSDFHIVRAYPNKMLRWGYFPEMKEYENEAELFAKKQAGHILWAARFTDWKHAELPLMTAKYLKEKGCKFHMDIIGGGDCEELVQKLYKEYELSDCVTLQGFKTPTEVRWFMEKADIYLVTSDRNEGWGAVVNEAMNSGCAVVANHMIGAVPFMITSGENGYIYCDGKNQQLFSYVEKLLLNREKCQSMGKKAMKTVSGEWNAKEAAIRLLSFCVKKAFLNKEDIDAKEIDEKYLKSEGMFYAEGPCSLAPILSERRQYKKYGKTID